MYEAILADTVATRTAIDGEEALDLLGKSIDAVLVDRRMPGMSGDDFLFTLRDQGDDTPVGMLSAVTPDVDIIDLPCDVYLTKPIDGDELRATVELLAQFDDIDETSREFLRAAAKRAALDPTDPDNTNTDAYERLLERMKNLRFQVSDQAERLLETHPVEAVRLLRGDVNHE